MSKLRVKAKNLTLKELREQTLFEENSEWLDVFSEKPEVIVADETRAIFYIWYGGESHYVHEHTPFGKEFDVFSFGFEKNKLCKDEVLGMIEKHLNNE